VRAVPRLAVAGKAAGCRPGAAASRPSGWRVPG